MTRDEPAGRYAVVVLDEHDDVGIAVTDLTAGPQLTSAGRLLEVLEPVPLGHKVALVDLAEGTVVRRYGTPIGSTTRPVPAGARVHVHNLRSDYIPTFGRRGGRG